MERSLEMRGWGVKLKWDGGEWTGANHFCGDFCEPRTESACDRAVGGLTRAATRADYE